MMLVAISTFDNGIKVTADHNTLKKKMGEEISFAMTLTTCYLVLHKF